MVHMGFTVSLGTPQSVTAIYREASHPLDFPMGATTSLMIRALLQVSITSRWDPHVLTKDRMLQQLESSQILTAIPGS